MKDYMGVDIPVSLLRDIAVRLKAYSVPERETQRTKNVRMTKAERAEKRRLAFERADRLSVQEVLAADTATLSTYQGKVLRLTDPKEFDALARIIGALIATSVAYVGIENLVAKPRIARCMASTATSLLIAADAPLLSLNCLPARIARNGM